MCGRWKWRWRWRWRYREGGATRPVCYPRDCMYSNLRHLLFLPMLLCHTLGHCSLHSLYPLLIGLPLGLYSMDLGIQHFTIMFE